MADKIRITADQVVSRNRGWTTYVDNNGTMLKARASALEVIPEAASGPSSTQPPGDTAMASEKKARRAPKTETNGIRTIGGKAVNIGDYAKGKTSSGNVSFHCGDELAEKLNGKSLDDVYSFAAGKLKVEEKELRAKYKHLNAGMQRMSLGNRLRAALKPKAA